MQETVIANRYQVQEKLGEGGMGVVYRTLDRLTGQPVALKYVTVRQEQLEFTTMVSGSSLDLRLALAQEFKMLASLRHPNIISVMDYGFEDDQPYFTMELLDAPQDLVEYAKDKPFDVKFDLLAQTLRALSYLHRRGILHRDLKPGNVLVTQDGALKVLDFGLAIDAQAARDGNIGGTLAYVAPEVLIGQPPSPASDLYALGVMAYELFSGVYPFTYETVEELIKKLLFEPPNLDALKVNTRIAVIIGRLLGKKPEDRYTSVGDVVEALGEVVPLEFDSAASRESFLQAARFVGREQELATLSAALDKAINGEGGAWLIGGESGVGKSRLLDEVRVLAMVQGVAVLRGQGVADGGLNYQLWRDIARRLPLYADLSDSEASVLKELVPDIAQLLGRDVPDAPELEGAAAQQRLISQLVSVLTHLRVPALILLEDLHWLRESLDVLKTLMPLLNMHALLVVGTYRDDEQPSLPQIVTGAEVMRLGRLTRENTAALAESMLGEAGKQDQIINFLQQQTEGNTFFLVEVVRVLAEDAGGLERIGAHTLPLQVFAGGIQRVVRRRLERMSPRAYALLQIAAVAGRELELKVLEAIISRARHVLPLHDDLATWLDECSNAAVLDVDDAGDWRFTHDKLREQLLADLTSENAKQLHRLVAEALEATYPDAPEYTPRLVRHWGLAEDYVKEAYYALRAGEQQLALNFAEDALSYFRRAAQHLTDEEQQTRLTVNMGQAYLVLGNYTQALEALEQGLNSARARGDQRRVADSLSWLGQISVNKGDYPPAEAYYNESLSIARAIGYRLRAAEVLTRLGKIAVYHAHYAQSTVYIEEAIELSTQLGDLATQAQAYNNLAISANLQGNYERAVHLHQESLKRARKLGDRFAIARSLNNLGEVHKNQERFVVARALYLEALPLLREINHKWGVAAVLDNLGYIAVLLGEPHVARPTFQEALRIGGEIGASTTTLDVMVGVARLLAVEGETERAAEIIGIISVQSGVNAEIERKVSASIDIVTLTLSEAVMQAALTRGTKQDLQAAVEQFLDEKGASKDE